MKTLAPLPKLPTASGLVPGTVSPDAWNDLVAYVEALAKRQDDMQPQSSDDIIMNAGSGGFRATLKRRPGHSETLPPFWPRFAKNAAGTGYICTVTPGVVYDHVTQEGDAVLTYDCPNQFTGADLALLDITSGQCVYVKYYTLATGAVGIDEGDKVEIVIGSEGLESLHYIPPVEADYGAAGYNFIKLAKFVVNMDGTFAITRYAGGSHISHFRELPMILSGGSGDATVFTKFDPELGKYITKPITGISPVAVAVTGEAGEEVIEVSIAGTDDHLNLILSNVRLNGSGSKTNVTLYWREGFFVGLTDPEVGDPVGTISVDVLGA
jgi:hypothetical protein